MRRDKGLLLGFRREAHAVDEMMGIALDMGQAEQRHQRQVLLDADAGPGREILGRHEMAGAQPGDTGGIEDRLVEALAVLARHAGIAKL